MPAKTKKAGNAASTSLIPPPPPEKTTSQSISNSAPLPSVRSKSHTGSVHPGTTSIKAIDGVELASKSSENSAGQPIINRKKQKRREKEAAKKAAEQRGDRESLAHNGFAPAARGSSRGYFREETEDFHRSYIDDPGDGEEPFFSGDEGQPYGQADLLRNGFGQTGHSVNGLAGKNKKKSKKVDHSPNLPQTHPGNTPSMFRNPASLTRSHLPATPSLSAAALRSAHQNFSHDQIWNTSTQAERENIKQFWLELGEEERRSLVKVEKEAVLRKMKEQQKHSCGCTVCGRKRTAIEEELEVLYDAYYEELEQFANRNNSDLSNGAATMSDPRANGRLRTQRRPMVGQFPIEGPGHQPLENDEDVDEEDYDEDEEPYSDDDIEEIPRGPPDFFTFGNSLTVKGKLGIARSEFSADQTRWDLDGGRRLAEE